MPERLIGYDRLFDHISARLQDAQPPLLIGITGPPASGKSTLAERLVDDLDAAGHDARFCPMDGFHQTNAKLDAAGLRSVKGRIDTFDGAAFAAAVAGLKTGAPFWWPLYSRQSHDPMPEGTYIDGAEAVYVIEGNYLLADAEPWRQAAAALDLRIFVDSSDTILHERLLQRHGRGGRSEKEAQDKIERTDMPNVRTIRAGRPDADILFTEAADG